MTSVDPRDRGGETGPDQEQPPSSNPIPDVTQRPDIVAPQHDPHPITTIEEENERETTTPDDEQEPEDVQAG